jgi:hypothetical protein
MAEAVRCGPPVCQDKIPFLNGLPPKLLFQQGGARLVSRDKKEAACIPVQAMHEHEAVFPGPPPTRFLEQLGLAQAFFKPTFPAQE